MKTSCRSFARFRSPLPETAPQIARAGRLQSSTVFAVDAPLGYAIAHLENELSFAVETVNVDVEQEPRVSLASNDLIDL